MNKRNMKKHVVILMLASLLPLAASAQLIPTTKRVCTKRCVLGTPDGNPKTVQFKEKMKLLQERKAKESDPEKLKEINGEEQEELEKHSGFVENLCHDICRNNPED